MKESKTLEFKEKISKSFLKTVSAFANYNTGKIIFGISDDGKIVGIDDIKDSIINIENKINDSINPKVDFSIESVKNTIELTVYRGNHRPYLYRGIAYKRNDTASLPVDQLEHRRMVLEANNLHYDQLEIEDTDLNFSYLNKAFENKLKLKTPNKDMLKTLGLLSSDGRYNVAASLLADKNSFPGVDIMRFGKTINDILFRKRIDGCSILELLYDSEEIFNNFYKIEKISGMIRKEDYLIPLEAFRETLANALVHRAWDINSYIRIAMYEDKIEIFSPGGLNSNINEYEYINGFVSFPTNPILANVFFRLGIIENFGTGIKRIKESYKDIANKPIFKVTDNSILTILPNKNSSKNLTTDEKIVYDSLANGLVLSRNEIEDATSFAKDKVLSLLASLIDKYYVEKIGSGRGTKYKSL